MNVNALQPLLQRIGPRGRRLAAFAVFAGPVILGVGLFSYIPVLWGFVLSFFEARGTVAPQRFVGLSNYASLVTDREFIRSLMMITVFGAVIVPLTVGLSLALAVALRCIGWGRTFFRTIFFLPMTCSYVAGSLVWRMSLFNGQAYGVANMAGSVFGLQPVEWISAPSPPLYWVALVTVRLWLQCGFYVVIFLAALVEVPASLYEAAHVDGASGWQSFRHVTLPSIRNASVSILFLCTIGAFQAFDEFYNVMGGVASPGNITMVRTPLIYLYDVAFTQQNYGYGSAGAFVLTLLIVVFSALQSRVVGFGRAEG